ncbi:hypothetical protein ACOMHN_054233 [Nucella lapillus]
MVTNATAGSGANASTVGYSLTDFSDGPQPYSQPWDTSDPFFSASTRVLLQRVLKCYVRQPIVLVGIPGNVLCCAVFLKQGLSDRINLLLFWMAVADLTNLVAQLLLMPGCYLVDPLHVANWSVIVNTKIAPINWFLSFVSGMLVLLLSVERCISVVAPFKAQRFLTYRIATDVMFYFVLISKPVFLVIMIVCCTITKIHLRRASLARVKMGGNVTEEAKSGENRITIMLLVVYPGRFKALVMLPEKSPGLINHLSIHPWRNACCTKRQS